MSESRLDRRPNLVRYGSIASTLPCDAAVHSPEADFAGSDPLVWFGKPALAGSHARHEHCDVGKSGSFQALCSRAQLPAFWIGDDEDGRLRELREAIGGDLGGTGGGRRFSAMFNTYTPGPHARHSPGLVLLTHIVADLGERGFASLDLGAGDAGYKRGFCRTPEPLFDSFVPLTALGQVAAAGARLATTFKRGIKRTPAMWSALQGLRRRVYAWR